MTTKILVFGAGALGGFLAASLARTRMDVALVAREPRLSQVRGSGIMIDRGGEIDRVNVIAHGDCTALARPDLVLLCTKTPDVPIALDQLAAFQAAPLVVLTVQNGVDAPDQVAQALPRATVLGARVHGFFQMDGGIVRHVGVEPSIAFGKMSGGDSSAEVRMAATLQQAGITHSCSSDIRRELWEKFLLATAIGGVATALGVTAGRLRENERHWALLEAAMRETKAIADRKGIRLADDCVERTLAFVETFPPDATTSFQRDLEQGRPSEFDALTGAVIRMADELGVDAPVHRQVAQAISERGLI